MSCSPYGLPPVCACLHAFMLLLFQSLEFPAPESPFVSKPPSSVLQEPAVQLDLTTISFYLPHEQLWLGKVQPRVNVKVKPLHYSQIPTLTSTAQRPICSFELNMLVNMKAVFGGLRWNNYRKDIQPQWVIFKISFAELITSTQNSFFGDLSSPGEWHAALLSPQSLSSYQESISI